MTSTKPYSIAKHAIWRAYQHVRANRGAAGIDDETIEMFEQDLGKNLYKLWNRMSSGSYYPPPVKQVEIPKAKGGVRKLGIPTVLDRLIQQALLQILQPLFEAGFSESSYGFRPGRNAWQAVTQAKQYIQAGRRWVVDLDLEKFFDRVNHDILVDRLQKRIGDPGVIRLIRAYLNSGIMSDGVVLARTQGAPQGGPLSPLLANVLLDEVDKELESRGHCFVRYADDANIYVTSAVIRRGNE